MGITSYWEISLYLEAMFFNTCQINVGSYKTE